MNPWAWHAKPGPESSDRVQRDYHDTVGTALEGRRGEFGGQTVSGWVNAKGRVTTRRLKPDATRGVADQNDGSEHNRSSSDACRRVKPNTS